MICSGLMIVPFDKILLRRPDAHKQGHEYSTGL